ncbi:MAG TPA: malonate decarboxylase holo-[acyl-carrier-protein] synthase [Telluria sp.]
MHWRHDLVWLSDAGWEAARRAAEPGHAEAMLRWQEHAWPCVARRQEPGVDDSQVCLGLALPPDPATGIKQRIGLQASLQEVTRATRPLSLRDALGAAPPAWRGALASLAAELPLHVYGSLALQSITGAAYLGPRSDIDLLLYPTRTDALQAALTLLDTAAQELPLDGELVFPGGAAVAWKEWIAAQRDGARVLVKERGGVRLASCADLLATLEA